MPGFSRPSHFCNERPVAWTIHVTPVAPRHMTRLLATVIACAALIAGCGSDDESGTEGGGATRDTGAEAAGASGEAAPGGEPSAEGRAAAARPPRAPRVTLRDSQFGPVFFDGHNRALYLF